MEVSLDGFLLMMTIDSYGTEQNRFVLRAEGHFVCILLLVTSHNHYAIRFTMSGTMIETLPFPI